MDQRPDTCPSLVAPKADPPGPPPPTRVGALRSLVKRREFRLELAVYRGRVGQDGVRGGTLDAVWCTPVFAPPGPPLKSGTPPLPPLIGGPKTAPRGPP